MKHWGSGTPTKQLWCAKNCRAVVYGHRPASTAQGLLLQPSFLQQGTKCSLAVGLGLLDGKRSFSVLLPTEQWLQHMLHSLGAFTSFCTAWQNSDTLQSQSEVPAVTLALHALTAVFADAGNETTWSKGGCWHSQPTAPVLSACVCNSTGTATNISYGDSQANFCRLSSVPHLASQAHGCCCLTHQARGVGHHPAHASSRTCCL